MHFLSAGNFQATWTCHAAQLISGQSAFSHSPSWGSALHFVAWCARLQCFLPALLPAALFGRLLGLPAGLLWSLLSWGPLSWQQLCPPLTELLAGARRQRQRRLLGGFCEWGACGPPKTVMQGAMGCSGGLGVLRPPQPLGKFYKHIRQGVLLLGVAPLGDAPPV